MITLAFHTAAAACELALVRDGDVLCERKETMQRGQDARLPGLTEALLGEVGLALDALDILEVDRVLRRLAESERLLSLRQLRGLRIAHHPDPVLARIFYDQSLSFVAWLVDRFGTGALPSFLTAMGTGTSTDAAARKAFGDDVAGLYAQWKDQL